MKELIFSLLAIYIAGLGLLCGVLGMLRNPPTPEPKPKPEPKHQRKLIGRYRMPCGCDARHYDDGTAEAIHYTHRS